MRPSSEEVKLYLHLFTDTPGDNGTPDGEIQTKDLFT